VYAVSAVYATVYAKSEKIEGDIMDSISFAEKRKKARKPHKQWPPDKRKTSRIARKK
jgi:hypothetical protein